MSMRAGTARRRLTARQDELMDLLVSRELTNEGLAREMGISVFDVKYLLSEAFQTYGVRTRGRAMVAHVERRRRERKRASESRPRVPDGQLELL